MEYIEANPLPQVCQECEEAQRRWNEADEAEKAEIEKEYYFDCGSCDHAGERWYLSRADELRIKKKGLLKAIERNTKQIAAIDKELEGLKDGEC